MLKLQKKIIVCVYIYKMDKAIKTENEEKRKKSDEGDSWNNRIRC